MKYITMVRIKKGKKRSSKKITYHGRVGRPVIHKTKTGRKFIMVRSKGGGVKRLYSGAKYSTNGVKKRLRL